MKQITMDWATYESELDIRFERGKFTGLLILQEYLLQEKKMCDWATTSSDVKFLSMSRSSLSVLMKALNREDEFNEFIKKTDGGYFD